jgi:hypothetical protein
MMKIGFASLALLAMATAADAAFILQFTQNTLPGVNPINYTPAGSGSTITSNGTGVVNGTWVPVNVVLGSAGGPSQAAFMSFTSPLTTPNAATQNGTTVNQTGYTGTIEFNFAPSSTLASNILTVNFNNGVLSGTFGGNAVGLTSAQPPNSVTYSSTLFPNLFAGLPQHDFALSFSGLVTPLGNGAGNNASSVSGTFSASAVPEPASIVMLSISALGGLGFYGVRRFRASAV